MMKSERRAFERFDLELPVDIKWREHSGKIRENRSISKNISAGGIYILLDNPIKKDAEIELWFDLPITSEEAKKTRVVARGKVVRRVENRPGFGHGIKFMSYKFVRVGI